MSRNFLASHVYIEVAIIFFINYFAERSGEVSEESAQTLEAIRVVREATESAASGRFKRRYPYKLLKHEFIFSIHSNWEKDRFGESFIL